MCLQVRSCRWSELPMELNTSFSPSSKCCCSSRSCHRCSLEVCRPPSYSRSVLHTSLNTQQWHACSSSVTAGCVVTASMHLMSGICFPESAEVLIIASQCRKSVGCLACLKCNIRTDGGRFYWKRTDASRAGFTIAGLLQWFMRDVHYK